MSEPGRKVSEQFQQVVPYTLDLGASGLASLTANASHGKPPMIGPVAERHGGDKRAQPFAVIRFLFGRALRRLVFEDPLLEAKQTRVDTRLWEPSITEAPLVSRR